MTRRRSLLRGVPRDGSPASSLLPRRSDFPVPIDSRFVAFALHLPRALIRAREEAPGPPRFLGNPCTHALVSDLGGSVVLGAPGCALRLEHDSVAFRGCTRRRHPQLFHFEALSHGLRTRCLRFAATVARVLPHGHARLASGWQPPALAGRDFHPRVASQGFRHCYMASSSPRLRLAHVQLEQGIAHPARRRNARAQQPRTSTLCRG